jgi:hypothetical protein
MAALSPAVLKVLVGQIRPLAPVGRALTPPIPAPAVVAAAPVQQVAVPVAPPSALAAAKAASVARALVLAATPAATAATAAAVAVAVVAPLDCFQPLAPQRPPH